MYAKFQSYSAQCSVKLYHHIIRGSMLLSVHIVKSHSAQVCDVYIWNKYEYVTIYRCWCTLSLIF
jgi:hypothetical protein